MAFNIGKYAEALERSAPAEKVRDIEAVTCEILHLKQALARNIVDIGLRLMEAKEMLPHGEWLPWLEGRTRFSEKSAQNYMRVAREFPNPQLVADLGVRKALALLELPPAERESFVEENGVIDMTSRELEKAIRERDAARKEVETAEASRTKMETDMKMLKELHLSAVAEADRAVSELLAAKKELEELRKRPVDVAVEVDQEAVEKARKEAVAEMEQKLAWAEKERDRAEKALLKAEKALAAAEKTAGPNAAILSRAEKAEAELADARRQLADAQRQLEGEGDSVSQNNVPGDDLKDVDQLFIRAQDMLNQIHGHLLKARARDNAALVKIRQGLLDISVYAWKCAE